MGHCACVEPGGCQGVYVYMEGGPPAVLGRLTSRTCLAPS